MKNARNLQVETLERQRYSDAIGMSWNGTRGGASSPEFRAEMPVTVSRSENIAHLEAAVLARLDGEKRLSAVEVLKARVKSGTYHINNGTLAQALQQTPSVRAILRK